MSAVVSVASNDVLEPFFDDACKKISERLRWHSDTKYSSTAWVKAESNCCVTTLVHTSPEQNLQTSAARVFMVNESTTRLRKIILKPPPEVAMKLRKWMGTCRLTYNMALGYINDGHEHKKTFYWLRNRFVTACNVPAAKSFLLDTPKHVREGTVKELAMAFKTNFAKRKKNSSHRFQIRFRSKKDVQSITIPKASFVEKNGGVCFYPRFLGDSPLLHFIPAHDCKLVLDRLDRFVLHVPVDVQTFQRPDENQIEPKRICAIDPGVRTFLTTWSPGGVAKKIGDQDSSKLYARLLSMDKLISSISQARGRSKLRKQKALSRWRHNIDNWKRDFHYQCANSLTECYDHIILPRFGSKRMSSKMDRRLKTKTVRSMLEMGHYAFRQRLCEVAEIRGVKVYECTEEYTSKTCSHCGWLHPSLGGAKTFKCAECGCVVDRDLQGAFNIYLKYCKTHPGSFPGV